MSGLNLLVAAIILWNTRYLEAAYRELRRQGRPINEDLLALTSPLGWSHISREQAAIAVDGFRPLNTARSRLKLVA